MVRACIIRDAANVHRIFVQRAKFKHWKKLGRHRETDRAFQRALLNGTLEINSTIKETQTLFQQ